MTKTAVYTLAQYPKNFAMRYDNMIHLFGDDGGTVTRVKL